MGEEALPIIALPSPWTQAGPLRSRRPVALPCLQLTHRASRLPTTAATTVDIPAPLAFRVTKRQQLLHLSLFFEQLLFQLLFLLLILLGLLHDWRQVLLQKFGFKGVLIDKRAGQQGPHLWALLPDLRVLVVEEACANADLFEVVAEAVD